MVVPPAVLLVRVAVVAVAVLLVLVPEPKGAELLELLNNLVPPSMPLASCLTFLISIPLSAVFGNPIACSTDRRASLHSPSTLLLLLLPPPLLLLLLLLLAPRSFAVLSVPAAAAA
jgi:hypothetical protein